MNYTYAVVNKETNEREEKLFCSMDQAFSYANKLNKKCGKSLYNIVGKLR